MIKKRGPGRPRGSKNKVTAQKAAHKTVEQNVYQELNNALVERIRDLLAVIEYLEEKLEAKR